MQHTLYRICVHTYVLLACKAHLLLVCTCIFINMYISSLSPPPFFFVFDERKKAHFATRNCTYRRTMSLKFNERMYVNRRHFFVEITAAFCYLFSFFFFFFAHLSYRIMYRPQPLL